MPKDKHSAVDGRIKRHKGYKTSLKVRKRIEEAFGWIKTVGGLAKTQLIGQAKLTGQALLCFAPSTWCAWTASAAAGVRIMRETRGPCAQNGQTGLKQVPKRAAQTVKCALSRLNTDAHSDAAALINTFSTAC